MFNELLKKLDSLDAEIKRHFIYTPDVGMDTWEDHSAEVEDGKIFRDDCDGYAWTAGRLIQKRNICADEKVRIALCCTSYGQAAGKKYDHIIVLVEIEGVDWAIDNRNRRVTEADSLGYTFYSTMRLSEEGVWRSAV